MHIDQLTLKNFRNFESVDIPLNSKMNIVIGNNGSGKSSLLMGALTAASAFFLGIDYASPRSIKTNANQPIVINIDDVADVIDVRAEDEFARVELLVSLKQELERLSPRELMIIRTYLDYPIEAVARKLKVRPNTVSKARRKIARELRKKLV